MNYLIQINQEEINKILDKDKFFKSFDYTKDNVFYYLRLEQEKLNFQELEKILLKKQEKNIIINLNIQDYKEESILKYQENILKIKQLGFEKIDIPINLAKWINFKEKSYFSVSYSNFLETPNYRKLRKIQKRIFNLNTKLSIFNLKYKNKLELKIIFKLLLNSKKNRKVQINLIGKESNWYNLIALELRNEFCFISDSKISLNRENIEKLNKSEIFFLN